MLNIEIARSGNYFISGELYLRNSQWSSMKCPSLRLFFVGFLANQANLWAGP